MIIGELRSTLIRGARLLDPLSGMDQIGDLLITGKRIAAIAPGAETLPPQAEIIDGSGLCLAPGLVDMRARVGEPGNEHKERIQSAAAAAAAGGVTSLACLPDTKPPIDDVPALEFVARRARQVKGVKIHPMAAATRRLEGKEITEIGLLKASGAVAFTDARYAISDARVMRRLLAYAGSFGSLVIQHPEEPSLAKGGVMNEGAIATRLGLPGIPAMAEIIQVERDLRILELAGGHLHFGHISTAGAVSAIADAKARGLSVSCDVTPHHLRLNELAVEGYRTFAHVSPPLRTEDDRLALVAGLVDGTIDAIASDHNAQDQDSKRQPFTLSKPGVIGLETMLSTVLSLVHEGRIGLLDLLQRMTVAPAKLLGLEAGALRVGAPADLILFDLEAPHKITDFGLKSLSKNTAFEGHLVQGRVLRTIIDGRTVFEFAKNNDTVPSR